MVPSYYNTASGGWHQWMMALLSEVFISVLITLWIPDGKMVIFSSKICLGWQHTLVFHSGCLWLARNIGRSHVSPRSGITIRFLGLFPRTHTAVIIDRFTIMRPHRFWPAVCWQEPKQGGMCSDSLENRHDFKASRGWQIFYKMERGRRKENAWQVNPEQGGVIIILAIPAPFLPLPSFIQRWSTLQFLKALWWTGDERRLRTT